MNDRLPDYAFVPGGPFPHPNVDGKPEPAPSPIEDGDWRESRPYLFGFTLFNTGYYWEAHEVWEGLWHAHGRRGPIADLVKGLIKLAAAGVKVRQGQPHGITTHAARAGACFALARRKGGSPLLGLNLDELGEIAHQVAESPPVCAAGLETRVARVFEFMLAPK